MSEPLPARELPPPIDPEESRLMEVGFRFGARGTHTSRTIMLRELRLLLDWCPPEATRADYLRAIREENCLGKRTVATRKTSSQRLSELYALDPGVLLFRVMRQCWYADRDGRPLLAMLLALARDPLLRATAPPVLQMEAGQELTRQQLTEAIARTAGHRLNGRTLGKVVRNAASSWTQSGHLQGRSHKLRRLVAPTPVAVAFALFLGYLAGKRGAALFESLWAQTLDAPVGELMRLAINARRLGLLEIKQSGGVVEVGFRGFLS